MTSSSGHTGLQDGTQKMPKFNRHSQLSTRTNKQ